MGFIRMVHFQRGKRPAETMGNRATLPFQRWKNKRQDLYTALEKEVNAELEKQRQRYRPKSVSQLANETGFTTKEIQLLYRSFKENCPNGIVNVERFQEIFSSFFYYGDATSYAKLVFGTFDVDSNGEISFEEFVHNLSILWRGPLDVKLRWIFSLYDRKGIGYIRQVDVLRVLKAVYDMMGETTSPPIQFQDIEEHARSVFQKMDVDGDGKIDFDEFIYCCRRDDNIRQSLELFDTILDVNRCLSRLPSMKLARAS